MEYSKIKPKLFKHFVYMEQYHIASPEKALLDTIYYRGSIPAMDELELDNINVDLLFEIQKRLSNNCPKGRSWVEKY